MRLIDADAAIDAVEFGIIYAKIIDRETGEVRRLFEENNEALQKAIERIKRLPTVEPKRGRWEPVDADENGLTDTFYCSECGTEVQLGNPVEEFDENYCMNCGAKNGGETDES